MKLEQQAAVAAERFDTIVDEQKTTSKEVQTLGTLVTDMRLDLKGLAVKASVYFAILAGLMAIVGPLLAKKLWG